MKNNNKNKSDMSCIDCCSINCDNAETMFPDFCLTVNMDKDALKCAMNEYNDPETVKMARVSASVENDGYMKWCRLEEIMVFAKRMRYTKLGIATCVGLMRESRRLTEIMRSNGFDVFGVACKCGMQKKKILGFDSSGSELGENMCNPILQAELLNRENTDFNIVMGLCVGHDSLFYKHSQAPVTTLITKDRVLGHNPAVALYLSDSYYKRVNKKINGSNPDNSEE